MNPASDSQIGMETEKKIRNEEKMNNFLASLHAARLYERDRMIWGGNRVYRHVAGVNGDWLEKWGEDEEEERAKKAEGRAGNEESKVC